MDTVYWLHIVESKSPQERIPSTYMLARANAPRQSGEGGGMPTVHYPSWEGLAERLANCNVDRAEIEKAKAELDKKGSYTRLPRSC